MNKTLDLEDLKNKAYLLVIEEINALIAILNKKGLKFTTYQAEFNTGWGENDIWFKRKLWEISTMIIYGKIEKSQRILDCGGASIIFSFYLASRGCQVETADIDWRGYGIVKNAEIVAKEMNWNMHNLYSNIFSLPYKTEVFDRVFCICVLEHLGYKEQILAIKEMSRVLKEEGIMGLTFDYGPTAFGNKYKHIYDINQRIIIPSELEIMGNIDYQENAWFPEQPGKTWGALFLRKPKEKNSHKRLLICTNPQSRLKVRAKSFLKKIKDGLWHLGIRRSSYFGLWLIKVAYKLALIKLKYPHKLHLGCGNHFLSGWTNIDIFSGDIRLDVLKGLPFKDNSVSFIYHAHFIEHFSLQENLKIFKECYRILKKNGVLRILFPDLAKHCQIYLNEDKETLYKYKEKGLILLKPEEFNLVTEWFNKGFYDFGHKFIYDFKTIEALAKKVGFSKIYLVEHGKSNFPELNNIDYYPDTEKLFSIVEIIK